MLQYSVVRYVMCFICFHGTSLELIPDVLRGVSSSWPPKQLIRLLQKHEGIILERERYNKSMLWILVSWNSKKALITHGNSSHKSLNFRGVEWLPVKGGSHAPQKSRVPNYVDLNWARFPVIPCPNCKVWSSSSIYLPKHFMTADLKKEVMNCRPAEPPGKYEMT